MQIQGAAYSLISFPSELGWMAAIGRDNLLCQLTFGHDSPQTAIRAMSVTPFETADAGGWQPTWINDLQAYARGERVDLSHIVVEMPHKTLFQQQILTACRRIPYGSVMTYGELAAASGSPRAARAVGNCMASNLVPLVIPCHRVVPSGGRLGGYSAAGGVHTKLRLLEAEGVDGARLRIAKSRPCNRLAAMAESGRAKLG